MAETYFERCQKAAKLAAMAEAYNDPRLLVEALKVHTNAANVLAKPDDPEAVDHICEPQPHENCRVLCLCGHTCSAHNAAGFCKGHFCGCQGWQRG